MANTFVVSRNHLIFGLCLPIAVLLGYLLAEPLDSGSLAVLVMVVSVLFVPLMMRWHHLLLIASWNAVITPVFFPGRPALWMIMACLSLFFGILGRSISSEMRFLQIPALTRSLLCLLAVVFVTALVTGGVGLRAFGSTTSYGGKGYFTLAAAIIGYFALTSRAIPQHRAQWYMALFFLPGVTAAISNLAEVGGPGFRFLYNLFPADLDMEQMYAAGATSNDMVRISGLLGTSQALYGFLLVRYGIRGIFDITRPWRLVLFLASVGLSLFAGFRSGLILFGVIFGILFLIEGLWKTKTMLVLVLVGALVSAVLITHVERMPLSVQRALSILPIKVDPMTKLAAQGSTEWRVEMWKTLLPEVPQYLFKGKGYNLNPQELTLVLDSAWWGHSNSYEVAAFAGDYHNGPLSVVIPFGLYGVVAFGWFLAVAIRVLYQNYRHGHPALRQINAALFAFFIARVVFFLFVFGAFYSDLFYFTGLVGLGVALNRGVPRTDAEDGLVAD